MATSDLGVYRDSRVGEALLEQRMDAVGCISGGAVGSFESAGMLVVNEHWLAAVIEKARRYEALAATGAAIVTQSEGGVTDVAYVPDGLRVLVVRYEEDGPRAWGASVVGECGEQDASDELVVDLFHAAGCYFDPVTGIFSFTRQREEEDC